MQQNREHDPRFAHLKFENLKQYNELIQKLSAASKRLEELENRMQRRGFKRQERDQIEGSNASREASVSREQYKNAIEEWKRGYSQDWLTSMYAILAIAEQIMILLNAWNLHGQLFRLASDPLLEMLSHRLDQLLIENPPEEMLPKLKQHISVDSDGKLAFESLDEIILSNGEPVFRDLTNIKVNENPEMDQAFRAFVQDQLNAQKQSFEDKLREGVESWLNQMGYEPELNENTGEKTGVYHNRQDHSIKLTNEMLQEMMNNENHPEQTLSASLQGKFGMEFEHIVDPPRIR